MAPAGITSEGAGEVVSTRASVVVIGAGAVGLSTALQLTRLGVSDVVVIDSTHVAGGSSSRSVGVVETQYVDPFDIALRVPSKRAFLELERDHGLRFTRNGYLRIGHTAEDARRFERSVAVQRELGIDDAVVLGPQEIAGRFPDVRCDDVSAALYGPSDGFVDGHLYCALLAELAQAGGARVLTHARCEGAEALADGGHRLRTAAGELTCELVVNAAGAWAQEVGAQLGTSTPILPQRHEAVSIHLPRTLDYMMPEVMDYSPAEGRAGLYFRHETFDMFLGGLHSEEAVQPVVDPHAWFEGVEQSYVEELAELLPHRLPSLAGARIGRGWAGLYPVSPDGRPQVGPCPENASVIAACGVGGYGIQVSPIVGRLAAEWIAFGEARSFAEAGELLPGRSSLVSGT
ncbi:MAG TPA: FAD-binding oxidoreductase [Solirubrobacteraceae bacterium]|jgi:sarcosine oxidase subunit beta|nr:FAD-binding oxidoreductase [Solirubrobacteraceae bacterium]